ncbi:hypothetical protein CH341_28410 [Rhodoplanes roseus]|uniref:PD-(D/E)XK nuclease-like domain-containing protein n=1 Tax=Rhodoplanes roseus TaxID=29409 RepID=A0A327KJ43_9BRAD|nr:hypothetical protein CH341_28410 [Rhodoplanes roseus]
MWREAEGLPRGSYKDEKGRWRTIGSCLKRAAAQDGGNFMSPEIAALVRREVAYREDGALFDQQRLFTNLLSSHPLTFNLFGPLKKDLDAATRLHRKLFPDLVHEVTEILFEHSPGRRDPSLLGDYTAFDVLLRCRGPKRKRSFIAIEVKYAETMYEPPARLRPRYDQASATSNLFINPDDGRLRDNPLQQLWRQHMLAEMARQRGDYDQGAFVVIAPRLNPRVERAVHLYSAHLHATLDRTSFGFITLEDFVDSIKAAGLTHAADWVHRRYCDFSDVDALI